MPPDRLGKLEPFSRSPTGRRIRSMRRLLVTRVNRTLAVRGSKALIVAVVAMAIGWIVEAEGQEPARRRQADPVDRETARPLSPLVSPTQSQSQSQSKRLFPPELTR